MRPMVEIICCCILPTTVLHIIWPMNDIQYGITGFMFLAVHLYGRDFYAP